MKKCLFFCALLITCSSFLFSHEIKAIVFDCGGVVVQSDRAQIVKFLAESFATSLSDTEAYLAKEKLGDLATGKVKESVFWENFAKKNQISLPEDFYDRYLSFIKNVFIPDQKMLELVKSLQDAGFKTPMLSDITEWQADGFKKLGVYGHFCPIFLSYELGLKKPDPAIFHYLLCQLKLSPKECIFIDDREANTEAAKALGIDSIHFTTLEALKAELTKRGI